MRQNSRPSNHIDNASHIRNQENGITSQFIKDGAVGGCMGVPGIQQCDRIEPWIQQYNIHQSGMPTVNQVPWENNVENYIQNTLSPVVETPASNFNFQQKSAAPQKPQPNQMINKQVASAPPALIINPPNVLWNNMGFMAPYQQTCATNPAPGGTKIVMQQSTNQQQQPPRQQTSFFSMNGTQRDLDEIVTFNQDLEAPSTFGVIGDPRRRSIGEVKRNYTMDSRAVFHWTLKAFSSLDKRVDSFCCCPRFNFGGESWWLRLFPNGRKSDQSEGDVMLDLRPGTRHRFRARYSVGIRTEEGWTEVRASGTHTFGLREAWLGFPPSLGSLSRTLISRSELFRRSGELLPRDTLTVTLELEEGSFEIVPDVQLRGASTWTQSDLERPKNIVKRNVADASVQATFEDIVACGGKAELSEKTGPEKIAEDVGKLCLNGDHTDVLLKVKDVEFKARRSILATRSPVLGATFEQDTVEVSIEDCEPEVFEQLLHFIYSGVPRELTSENASALYVLAARYMVNEVKALCVRCMRDTLCLDTFCDTLMLSLMYREDELLETATDFLSRNMVDVMKTDEWQKFIHQHPAWANEILIRGMKLIQARYEALVDWAI